MSSDQSKIGTSSVVYYINGRDTTGRNFGSQLLEEDMLQPLGIGTEDGFDGAFNNFNSIVI